MDIERKVHGEKGKENGRIVEAKPGKDSKEGRKGKNGKDSRNRSGQKKKMSNRPEAIA